jgi:hypothetical protein
MRLQCKTMFFVLVSLSNQLSSVCMLTWRSEYTSYYNFTSNLSNGPPIVFSVLQHLAACKSLLVFCSSLRSLKLVAKMCLDISILATSFMEWREYHFNREPNRTVVVDLTPHFMLLCWTARLLSSPIQHILLLDVRSPCHLGLPFPLPVSLWNAKLSHFQASVMISTA